MFTSGTTGSPKGVVMTHGQTLRAYLDWCDWADLRPGDRYLIANPFFHIFGYKAGCLASLMRGATIFPVAVFDPGVVLELVERERITVLPGPPTIYQSLLDHPDRDRHDISSLRVAVTGAADIPVELIRRVREELPFERILTGYGLTEAGTVTGSRPDDDFEHIATTVGVPWPGFEVRTVDEAGTDDRARRAGRGGRPRRDRDARRTSTTPRRPRPRSTPTAGCTPATSARSTPTATCASSGASRTCSSSAGSTRTRPRSRTCCSATRGSRRRR